MGRRTRRRFQGFVAENVKIIDTGNKGKGVGKIEDKVVFVPFTVPGDIVDVFVFRDKKSYYEGEIEQFHTYSDLRTEPKCKHFGVCGGCKWQNLEYQNQLSFKHKQVKENLERIGKIDTSEMMDILPSENIFFYRNKLEYSASNKKWLLEKPVKGEIISQVDALGFHIPGRFDKVLDIEECLLQEEPSNQIRLKAKEYALKNHWEFYDSRSHIGFFRNLVIRSNAKGEIMLILIVSKDEKEKINGMLDFLAENFPQIKSLQYIINNKMNDSYADLTANLYSGEKYLTEKLGDLENKIGPKSFFQTNTKQAKQLYDVVVDFVELTGKEIVYDLYTGTGTIANYIASKSKKVVGIESIEEAIDDAKQNAKLNNIKNTSFFVGEVEKVFTDDFINQNGNPDLIITDPPRAGMHKKVIEQLLSLQAGRIIYVSCNSATQARDIELMAKDYSLSKIQPVDMFPHTQHVENVVLLKRITK